MIDAHAWFTPGDYVIYGDSHIGHVVATKPHSWVTADLLTTPNGVQRTSQVAQRDFGVRVREADEFVIDLHRLIVEIGSIDVGVEKPLTGADWEQLKSWLRYPCIGGELLPRTPIIEGFFQASAVGRFDNRPRALEIMSFLIFGEPYRFRAVRP